MQAALGVSQLKKLPQFVAARRKNWKALYDGVKNSPVLREKFIPIEPTPESNPSWFGFPVLCEGIDRFGVTKFLEEHKIGTRLLFGGHLLKQPAYKGIPHRISGTLKNTERVVEDVFWIGVHAGLRPEHLEYMLVQLEAATRVMHR